MDLNDLLERSAPPIATRIPELGRAITDLASESENGSVEWRHRVALAGVTVAALVGAGSVASAAGVLPGWPVFNTSSGTTCSVEIHADAHTPGDLPEVPATISDNEARATVAEAQAFLRDFNYQEVNRAEAVAWWRTQEDQARQNQPDPGEQAPPLAGDDLEVTAVSQYVAERLRQHLAAQGMDFRAVAWSVSDSCRGDSGPTSGAAHRATRDGARPIGLLRATCSHPRRRC